jgi:hypothetical protein
MLAWSTPHTLDVRKHPNCQVPTDAFKHYRVESIQTLLLTRQQHGLNNTHLLPFQFVQMPTKEVFLLQLQIMYNLRKHKLSFPSDVHKENTDPQCCLLSHSSVIAQLTTRRSGKTQYLVKLQLFLPLLHKLPLILQKTPAFFFSHHAFSPLSICLYLAHMTSVSFFLKLPESSCHFVPSSSRR